VSVLFANPRPLVPKARADRVPWCAVVGSPASMWWRSLCAMAVVGGRCYMAATRATSTRCRSPSDQWAAWDWTQNPRFQGGLVRSLPDCPRYSQFPGGTTDGDLPVDAGLGGRGRVVDGMCGIWGKAVVSWESGYRAYVWPACGVSCRAGVRAEPSRCLSDSGYCQVWMLVST
jgi:hypothetical protein